MPWYPRILTAIKSALPTLAPRQATNLALLVSTLLAKRTCCLSALARAYPAPATRRCPAPKHDLLHPLICPEGTRSGVFSTIPASIPSPSRRR